MVVNKSQQRIRILLANDQELMRVGLKMIFQSESNLDLIGLATTFDDTLQQSQKKQPDIILLDLFDCIFQEGSCIDRIPELINVCPSAKILVLTLCHNSKRHLVALRNGAIGIFHLTQPIEILIKAIHKIYEGEVWIPNALTTELLKDINKSDTKIIRRVPQKINSALTSREFTIARLLAQGISVREIAGKLHVSEKTVRNQLVTIYSKLGVHNHIDLVLRSGALGLN